MADPEFDIAFVWNRSPGCLAGLPETLALENLDEFAGRRPDLVIEMAHPSVTAAHGAAFLRVCDYLPLSVTALADERLQAALMSACAEGDSSLFIPHGALIGLDNLVEARDNWAEVCVTFTKHPDSLDLSGVAVDPAELNAATVVFDGSVREAATLFPRNVNTMATCAQGKFVLPEALSFPRRRESRNFNPIRGLANPAVLLDLDFRLRGNDQNSRNWRENKFALDLRPGHFGFRPHPCQNDRRSRVLFDDRRSPGDWQRRQPVRDRQGRARRRRIGHRHAQLPMGEH
ncbi:MAG: aspartate dehydrogenase domain-containing protein [Xanthomonadales bacterium]|nr:aspartate dehydrogenase domain-containing protein [Xanthomonadales bacterium]